MMRKSEFFSCILAGVAVCFTALHASLFPAAVEGQRPCAEAGTRAFFCSAEALSDAAPARDVLLTETEHGGADYLGKIIFIGDSRTYGLKHFAMLEGGEETKQVWTPQNGTMSVWDMQNQKILYPDTGTEMTCAEAAVLKQPEIMILSLGFNGFEIVDEEYFVSEYVKLINALQEASPSSRIILQSMFPVCRSYTETKITNAAIHEGNKTIVEVAKRTDVKYLNTAEALADDEGFLREEYASDGCHLTPLGLDVELNYICTHMYPEVSP